MINIWRNGFPATGIHGLTSSDGILTNKDLKDITEAKEDIKAGRVHTPEQVRKNLGI